MDFKEDIKPITYLKNHAADLVRKVSEESRTLVITQNGEAKVVVMNIEAYQNLRDSVALLKLLAASEEDLKAGRVVSHKDALARARASIGRAEKDA